MFHQQKAENTSDRIAIIFQIVMHQNYKFLLFCKVQSSRPNFKMSKLNRSNEPTLIFIFTGFSVTVNARNRVRFLVA